MGGGDMEQFPLSIINWIITALVFLGVMHIMLYGLSLYIRFRSAKLEGTDPIIRALADDISGAILRIWLFARPIVQLIIVLFVIFSFAQILGVTKENIAAFNALDIKTVLAFFVVGAFCVAAFLSENPASWLKDLALVVIGFYFGTKAGL
jgi:hypothetical protein